MQFIVKFFLQVTFSLTFCVVAQTERDIPWPCLLFTISPLFTLTHQFFGLRIMLKHIKSKTGYRYSAAIVQLSGCQKG